MNKINIFSADDYYMSAKSDATQFWVRYKKLASKDFFVVLKAKISQSTLSSWKTRKLFPRADVACSIAKALNTTVEYLVNGMDKTILHFSAKALEIASMVDSLSEDGYKILLSVSKSLVISNPKKNKR